MADVFSFNKAIIMGRVGNPPKRIMPKETPAIICKFEVATTEKLFKKGREPYNEVDWHDIVCFGKLAEFVLKYIRSGELIHLEGKMKERKYTDKDTGKTIKKINIRASAVTFVGKTKDVDGKTGNEDNGDNGDKQPEPF